MIINFKDFLIENNTNDDNISETELESIAESLEWEDIYDLYSEDEVYEDEELEEALTAQGRLRRGQRARRMRGKLSQIRNIRLRRVSNLDTLRKRAKIAARRALMKRFLRNRKNVSPQERSRIEAQVSSMGGIVNTLSVKMLPRIRQLERNRLSRSRTGKK